MTMIVVGVDGSAGSEHALTWALHEARRRDEPVRAVHVWHPDGTPGQTERLAALTSVAGLRERLAGDVAAGVRAVAEREGLTDVTVTTGVRYGHPAQELIQEAGDGAMLVVGSRGRGEIAGTLLGSVSQSVTQSAPGPVVVVPGDAGPGDADATAPVVVGVDGSPASVRALRFAHDAAAHRGAAVRVVHAWSVPYVGFTGPAALPPQAIDDLEAHAAATLRDTVREAALDTERAEVETYLVPGPAVPALLEAAERAGLLVVGSRGYGGWKGLLLGSVSARCVTQAPGPVAVVPGGAEAP